MSLSARTPANVDTYYYIPKVYTNKVIDAVHSELVAWDAITSEWRDDLVKGNILYIPKTNIVAAIEVVVGTKGATTDPLNTAGVALTIDQWWQAPVDIDYMTIRQTQANVEDIAVKEAAYAVSVKIDTTVCTLFSSLGGYTASAYGTDGQTFSDDIWLYLVETLNESNVPQDGRRSLVTDPSGLADICKIDKFVSRDYMTNGIMSNGVIGKSPIYGCTVRVTNNLVTSGTGNYGCLLHEKAIASAAQIDTAWVKEYEDLHQRRYHSEALWGVIEANDSFGIPFYTRLT